MDHANRISHRTRSLFSPHSDNRQMPRESRLWRLVETQAQLIARRQGAQLRLADWPSIFQPAFRLLRDWAVPNSAKQIILRGQRRMIRVTVPLFPTFRKLRGTIRQPQESSAQEAAGAASIFRSRPGKRLPVFQTITLVMCPTLAECFGGHDGYLMCSLGRCVNGFRSSSGALTVVGGTSAGAPAFAGIVAIINQVSRSSQGNINPKLYSLTTSAPAVFHDITSGGNQVPCRTGTADCNVVKYRGRRR